MKSYKFSRIFGHKKDKKSKIDIYILKKSSIIKYV